MSALFERWTGLALLDPGWLLLALLVPLALWLAWRRGHPALEFAPLSLFPGGHGLPRSWRTRLLPLPRLLFAAGLVLAVVALARPAQREQLPLETEGIDILLVLDTSSSMTANDMDRRSTRLAVAQDAATRFVEGREHDRIGLLTFARYPDVRCPLTLDHDALSSILAGIRTVDGEGPEDATGIGTALARAAQVLSGSGAASKVIILLTDGDENVAEAGKKGEIAPSHAAQLCRKLGIRVYAIVAGTGRPDPGGTWKRPDTKSMARIAARTGGALLEARDAEAMTDVYERIDALERTFFEEPRLVYRDRYLAFLLLALLLLVVGRLLSATLLEVLP